MDLSQWNLLGRRKNAAVCAALASIIDEGGASDEDFTADERSEALADAVLARVAALNAAGDWREARARFDPAHRPFIPHMDGGGLRAVVILGPDHFLVRRRSDVLRIDGDTVQVLDDVGAFAISRDRRWLVLATARGLVVQRDLGGRAQWTIAWPEGGAVDPRRLESLDIANDGTSLVFASDTVGIWSLQRGTWIRVAPRPGVGDVNDDDDDEAGELPNADARCDIQVGSYARLRAAMVGQIGIDGTHAAISPDGRLIAYGWQDAIDGHHVDRMVPGGLEPLGTIAPRSDYPYFVRFTDDSTRVLSNSRHRLSGVTVSPAVASLGGDEAVPTTDEYLRAYAIALMPGALFGRGEPVAWIGGAGWSHAAPLGGGKPVFTQFLGSVLNGSDYDPVSNRVAVASDSGMLHVLDPSTEAEPGRERGYRPRRELYRWILWDHLEAPIRW